MDEVGSLTPVNKREYNCFIESKYPTKEKRMVEFLKKATEWMLDREAELAKKCAVDLNDVEKQIAKVEEKKEALERECRENREELEKILTRLRWIRTEELKCRQTGKNDIEKEGA